MVESIAELELSPSERRVFLAVRNSDQIGRKELAERLGFSKGMLSKTIQKLALHGLVEENLLAADDPRVGQPPRSITLKADAVRSVGLAISTFGAQAAVTNLSGEVLWLSPETPIRERLDDIVETVLDLVRQALVHAEQPLCDIGFSIPGILARDGRVLDVTPGRARIPYAEIAGTLKQHFPRQKIVTGGNTTIVLHVLEPANLGRTLFVLTLHQGIKGQIFDRDRMFRGAGNLAGNIGSLVPEPGPRPSLRDLARHLDCPVETLTYEFVDRLLDDRDGRLLSWIDERGEGLSLPLATVAQLINPDVIVLDGELPRGVLDALARRVDLGVLDVPGRVAITRPEIRVSRLLGIRAETVSAALLPLANYLFQW